MMEQPEETRRYQKILLKMPLRAEYINVQRLIELSDLYSKSEVRRCIWRKWINPFGKECKEKTDAYYLHIDPLANTFRSLQDFFVEMKDQQRRFLLGVKGTGKTFNTLLALNKAVRLNQEIKPCYISFDVNQKVVYIKKPSTYLSTEPIIEFDNFEEYISWANLIIFDEIHYYLEYLIESKLSIEPFITLVNKILEKKCKVLLISENVLLSYAEKLQSEQFNKLCLSFGLYPSIDSGENFTNNVVYDALAFREICGFTRYHLTVIDAIYEFDIPPIILDYLTISGCTARAFFKLMKMVDWKLNETTFSNLIYRTQKEAMELSNLIKLDGSEYYENTHYPERQWEKKNLRSFITSFIQGWCKR